MTKIEKAISELPWNWRVAGQDVLNTMGICLEWFRENGIKHPSADAVVYMAGLVLDRVKVAEEEAQP